MRTIRLSLALFTSLAIGSAALAEEGPQQFLGATCGGDLATGCDVCGGGGRAHGHHVHHFGRHGWIGGACCNCGCGGSYKFPVPPLYTYHWPGMYQQHRIIDYRSPWRFPPLQPYSDRGEVLPEALGKSRSQRRVQPASAVFERARSSRPASFSDHVEQMWR